MDQQSLPTTLDTSPQLYQAAPALYGTNVGSQTQSANDNMAAIQTAFQQQQQQEQQMRPLDLAYRQAEAAHMAASSDYLGAEAAGTQQRTSQATQEQSSNVAANSAKNTAAVGQSQVDVLQQHGDKLGQAAAVIGNLPPNTPSFVIDKMLQDNLGDMYHPGLMQSAWGQQNPQEIGANLKALSDASYQARDTSKAQAQKDSGQMARTSMEVGGRQSVAEMETATKLKVAEQQGMDKVLLAQTKAANDAKNAATALRNQASNEPDPQKKAAMLKAATLQDQIQQAHEMSVQTGKNLGDLNLPGVSGTAPIPSTPMPSSSSSGPAQAATPGASAGPAGGAGANPNGSSGAAVESGFVEPPNDAIALFQKNLTNAKSQAERDAHMQMFAKHFGPRAAAALAQGTTTQ